MNTAQSSSAPNPLPRHRGGLVLFGCYVDPIEITLHLLVFVILGIPAVRASAKDSYVPKDGLAWISAIIGASTFVRLSPTDRVDAYIKLNSSIINHEKPV